MAFLTKRSSLHFERLEDRRLLAIDMFVIGDDAASEIGKTLYASLGMSGGAEDVAPKVVNIDPSHGGDDPESVDSAERRSPTHLRNRSKEGADDASDTSGRTETAATDVATSKEQLLRAVSAQG